MAIAASELYFCFSGGAANSTPSASLGGTRSANTISDATMNNLFDDVSAAEASAGDQEYRGIFLYMANTTLTLSSARVWVSANTPATGDEIYITTDSIGLRTGANQTMSSISDEGTAPTAIGTWTTGTLSLGNMTPTSSWPLWIKRSVSVGASSYASNSATIAWDGETA